MELHVALSLRLDATGAYRLAHAYRDEELARGAARIEDCACDADFTEHPQYCAGLRAAAALLTTGGNTAAPAATGEAYDGELAMLRGLVRTLRATARYGTVREVQQLLAEHAADDAAARLNATTTPKDRP
jgi:hypothetical protein